MERLELDAWLDGPREYAAGVALYNRLGGSDTLKRLFARRDDVEALLVKELTALRDALPAPVAHRQLTRREAVAAPAQTAPARAPRPQRPSDSPDAPPEVRALVRERKTMYREAQALKATLELLPTQQERATAAFRILDLQTAINRIWDQTNHYDEHGRLPEPQTEQVGEWAHLPDLELVRLLDSHRKYVSKYRKRTRSADVEAEWQKRSAEIPQLEKLIGERKRDVVPY